MSFDPANLPSHGGILVFGNTHLKNQNLNKKTGITSDGIKIPNYFWLKTQKIEKLASGDEHALFASENGRCYSFGKNDWGQLGLGKEEQKELDKPNLIKPLKNLAMLDIAAGRSHSLVMTTAPNDLSSKVLHGFGSNADNQLGVSSCNTSSSPITISVKGNSLFPTNVKKIACGSDFSMALTEDGIVYAWGDNSDGQLGNGTNTDVSVPTKLSLPKNFKSHGKITDIQTSYHISVLLFDKGVVLIAGENFSNSCKLFFIRHLIFKKIINF